jgi:hypothetical protein
MNKEKWGQRTTVQNTEQKRINGPKKKWGKEAHDKAPLYGRNVIAKWNHRKYPCGDGEQITFCDLSERFKRRKYGPS